MLYQSYQVHDDFLSPIRTAAHCLVYLDAFAFWDWLDTPRRHRRAFLEMLSRFQLTHSRPAFDLEPIQTDRGLQQVTQEIALDLPFGKLLRFAREDSADHPRILVTAPLSGHFSTLLRSTVQTLLHDHEVYLTDWTNARDVPLEAGRFGVDEYIEYLITFLETIGDEVHLLAVCQSCVQALAAVAIMSEERHSATPRSMTLMSGPIDTRESPTIVNKLANERSISWFKDNVIAKVPSRYRGAGRSVYPGFVQLSAFMSMNMDRHRDQHRKLFRHLAAGEEREAKKIKDFYDEYFAVLDLTEEFYLETIERIFQRADLAKGNFTYKGRAIYPSAIRRTALLTVEGGRDDICSLGQTAAAHDLCDRLHPHLKRHHLQANVGHYGTFAGKRWNREIYPVVRNMILAMN